MLLHPNCSRSVHIADSAVAVNVCTLPRGWKLDGLLFPLPAQATVSSSDMFPQPPPPGLNHKLVSNVLQDVKEEILTYE
jgi:hypothetical protein